MDDADAAMPLVQPERLIELGTALYEGAGMRPDEARLVADTLVQADLWGHQSHGVLRMAWYLARLRSGVCDPAATPEIVTDAGAIAVLDGHDAMGQVVAARAMNEAVERARLHGIGAVAVRNSNHFGTAFYYTLRGARADCLAFLSTNASPAMAPWGGRQKGLGNNPWSWACPAGDMHPVVTDMACTAVARGKIYLARQKGQAIPQGWALNAEGHPTIDAQEAIDGIILPMAQHKGYAIAVMMDIISGVLTGSGFGSAVAGPYQAERRSRAGHFAIAIDIARLIPIEDFTARVRQLVAELKAVPLAPGCDEIFYPGEIEARNDRVNRRQGLRLPSDTIADLRGLAAEAGLEALLSPV
jgi:LDH2 family malate/lactate/ureidoglycolate dehydrogenase